MNPRKRPLYCIRCGADMGHGKKYCSKTCSAGAITDRKIADWKSGVWGGSDAYGIAKPVRDYLLKKANHSCTNPECDVPGGFKTPNPETGVVPLNIDHRDGDAYNNWYKNKDNLVVLCLNCHGLTPNYGNRNKNGTRKYRYKPQ